MKTIAFASLAAILAVSTPAAAQNFTGPSVGVQAGWEQNDVRAPKTDLGTLPITAKKDTASVGAFAAYDKEFGHFVLGGEAGFTIGTSDTVAASAAGTGHGVNPLRSIDLSLRAGYLIDPQTLVYGRGGYVNARFRTTVASATSTGVRSQDRDGWSIGAGVERVIVPHVSARLEYRYTDLSDGAGKWDRHQVLTGIAYRF